MSKDAIKRGAAVGAVLALAAAPAAFAVKPADPGSQGQGHGQAGLHGQAGQHGKAGANSKAGGQAVVTYVFKGVYAGADSVDVKRGNAHVRKANLVDTTVAFDLSAANIVADDTTGDGSIALDDVAAGDKVVVKARLPRTAAGAQPFAAKQLVDQTHLAD